ncbi:ATP synthase subunit I [uncultured Gemmiger sp.]|uniref:ATP synthase subunit I n=1 Tax=uncultured Gemmiger sp. TaxID=1623490 RepID=UPI0025F48B4A|nr:ATP synthase subunit I [uncultured Gemmiger sp.]
MRKYRDVLAQVLHLAVIVAICVAAMFGVYAVLGRFDGKVLLGGLIGGGIAIAHFLFLSITIARALDRAREEKNAARVQLSLQASTGIRLLFIAVVLVLLFRADICDPVAALIPLLIAQFALKFIDLLRSGKGEDKP